jgi:hypothetical protein
VVGPTYKESNEGLFGYLFIFRVFILYYIYFLFLKRDFILY